MNNLAIKVSTEIQALSSTLLSTLDESEFFSEMSKFFYNNNDVEQVRIYRAIDETSVELIAENETAALGGEVLKKGEGLAGYVIRTKRSYFSNNAERDPLFAGNNNNVKAELCVPIAHEGVILATLHLQSTSGKREFSRNDMISIQSIIDQLGRPIANMKMYLQAKALNETLLKKIEKKDKELEDKEKGLQLADSLKVCEQEIVGKSKSVETLRTLADKLSLTDVNVLIQGEIGSGREMTARRIHCRSERSGRPFVAIDCSSYQESQLEIELFGQETGGFSNSASQGLIGILEKANGGTLYINSICSLSTTLQAKLLHFIKEEIAFRVGGQVPFRSDVRVITSTDKDLNGEVVANNFREDLFYALSTMTIDVPALRERTDDIELLATYFLNSTKTLEGHKSFAPGVIKVLTEYFWPGNVRELKNIVERAYILADGKIVEECHLPEKVINCEVMREEEKQQEDVSKFSEITLNELERKHICLTLEHLGGNKTKAAKALGITVKTLYNKLHNYGMIER
ncbi:MAG: sigma-54-dependent Fis family transcriptional regulator [Bacteriovoracaceae bacterium]|nr:sigma-54-dependent Fis family transcriptional regulator [Bacteriovoracaceae bacterium]